MTDKPDVTEAEADARLADLFDDINGGAYEAALRGGCDLLTELNSAKAWLPVRMRTACIAVMESARVLLKLRVSVRLSSLRIEAALACAGIISAGVAQLKAPLVDNALQQAETDRERQLCAVIHALVLEARELHDLRESVR